jgi:hypothetical protein
MLSFYWKSLYKFKLDLSMSLCMLHANYIVSYYMMDCLFNKAGMFRYLIHSQVRPLAQKGSELISPKYTLTLTVSGITIPNGTRWGS